LGINDSAAGTVALCPLCKQKFKVPAQQVGAKASAEDEFPVVEVVEDVEEEESKPAPRKPALAKQRPAEDDVALRDDDGEVTESDDEDRPKKSSKKKKNKRSDADDSSKVMMDRIRGAVAVVLGIAFVIIGVAKLMPQRVFDNLGEQIWIAPTAFGGICIAAGIYYLVKDLFRGE
jgi:hypothetical protein